MKPLAVRPTRVYILFISMWKSTYVRLCVVNESLKMFCFFPTCWEEHVTIKSIDFVKFTQLFVYMRSFETYRVKECLRRWVTRWGYVIIKNNSVLCHIPSHFSAIELNLLLCIMLIPVLSFPFLLLKYCFTLSTEKNHHFLINLFQSNRFTKSNKEFIFFLFLF